MFWSVNVMVNLLFFLPCLQEISKLSILAISVSVAKLNNRFPQLH